MSVLLISLSYGREDNRCVKDSGKYGNIYDTAAARNMPKHKFIMNLELESEPKDL
jgi:hypothetical protein